MSTNIFVIDDVETNRFALRDIISDMGYRPVLAENGNQALKMLERIKPELIISDIAIPEMDGYELCVKIKSNPDLRDIPIVFISAFDDPEDVVRGFNVGGEDYITKPFIPEVVKARVNLHLKLADSNKNMMDLNRKLQASITEQLNQMEVEKKKVLFALLRVARENAGFDPDYMDRVSYNCRIMTEAMQLSEKYGHLISDSYIDTIELAAPLCDLGNVAIPTNILKKKGSLDEEEMEIQKHHTTIGANILEDIKDEDTYNDFIQMAIDIARYHHENWNGTGYPEGISEDKIPLSAQIVGIVSAFCGLTEERSHRGAYTREEAIEIMQKEAGEKFCPDMVDILQKISKQFH